MESLQHTQEMIMTNFESQCYGISQEDIRAHYMNGITARLSGLEMVVMSVLSDAQELLAMGRNEDSRKQMNVAKFILCEMMDAKESA
jgi:diaminopimelate decarboxylase